jgi:hypothetical protein
MMARGETPPIPALLCRPRLQRLLEVNLRRDHDGRAAQAIQSAAALIRLHQNRPVTAHAVEVVAGGTRFGRFWSLKHGEPLFLSGRLFRRHAAVLRWRFASFPPHSGNSA